MAMTTERRVGTVLVVDDSELFRKSAKRALISNDRCALTAAGPVEAKELLDREHVDLVVIDVVLGSSSGIDLLQEIKRAHPTLRAVMMSACSPLSR